VEGDSEKKALPETPPLIGGRERILLVDDEEPIVRIEKAMLEGLGYQVEAKTNSIEAIDEFSRNPNAYDLIITDMTMPGMTGDQLAKTVQAITPRQPIIICTGFSERLGTNMAKTLGIKGALMKPVTKSELAHTVRAVLDDNHRSS
jgi:CheY-like chemotaxis protein